MKIIDKVWNMFMLKRKKVSTGTNLKINGRICIHGSPQRIKIGNNVIINSDENINPTSGFHHTHLCAAEHGSIIIGNNVGMSHVNITSHNHIEIQDDVMLGSGVKIWDTDFHSLDYETRIHKGDTGARTAPIMIKKGAFIGACAMILKGVTIGEYAVIGAGAVVTKDVPCNEVWAGNPAKFIRRISS